MSPAESVLVVGIGDPSRGDAAVGVHVVRRLEAYRSEYFHVLAMRHPDLSLVEAWYKKDAVVVDAVSSGAEPGTIHRFQAHRKPLPAEMFRLSTHSFGLAETVELARTLNQLPSRLLIYGIEIGDATVGAGLSPAVARAAEIVVREILHMTGQPLDVI